tara:strand:+ start:558 stop:1565 length:1008 start_codon:yes stop_codon:yes gene_type:complete
MNGLLSDPRFMIGMGLLGSNQPSLTPQNPMQNIMQNMMAGQQMKQQLSAQEMAQQKFELDKKYKEAQMQQMQAPKAREMYEAVDGKKYWKDDPLTRVNPNAARPQNHNQPFNADGTPNTLYQGYEKGLRTAGAAQNNINLPPNMQIKGDYVVTTNENNEPVMTVIKGSKTDLANQAKEKKATDTNAQEEKTAQLQVDSIQSAKEKIMENPSLTTGFFGNIFKNFGGTNAKDVDALLTTIRANISFDYLNMMRQNSPTGGALGNVSEGELHLLGNTAKSIEQAQSAEQLLKHLDALDSQFLEVIHGKEAATEMVNKRKPKQKVYTWNPETELIEEE